MEEQVGSPIEVIRNSMRGEGKSGRAHKRSDIRNRNRRAIRDVTEIITTFQNDEIMDVANRLKQKNQVSVLELRKLKHAFIVAEENITAFLNVTGALQGLVRELSGTNAERKFSALNCCCNLGLANETLCHKLTKASSSYLTPCLDGLNNIYLDTCIWTLGNMAGSGMKSWKVLRSQGALNKLLQLLKTTSVDVKESTIYAMTLYVKTGFDKIGVSFGSSKGSMVETLVYESPLREEPEATSPSSEAAAAAGAALLAGAAADPEALAESKRVRVSFFECQRPVQLPPAAGDADAATPLAADSALLAMAVSSPEPVPGGYQRQASTDSGWDNPFRPDGNLSREADEIVELIKGGKPITPTSGAAPAPGAGAGDSASPAAEGAVTASVASAAASSPYHGAAPGSPATQARPGVQQNNAKVGANGNAAPAASGGGAKAPPGSVEVQRGTVDASQAVEHVVLKKKQKCKCCVIQ